MLGVTCLSVPVWDCSGAKGCAAHTALRLLKAPPEPPPNPNFEDDKVRYNAFMSVRANGFSVCRDFAHLNSHTEPAVLRRPTPSLRLLIVHIQSRRPGLTRA